MTDWPPLRQQLMGDTGRLAATYLLIIMVLTIVFSGIIYSISASQFDRPFPPRGSGGQVSEYDDMVRSSFEHLLEQRAQQARAELFASLVLLNIAVLIGGTFVSYYLARMTLRPIEAAMESQARFVSDASHELRTPLTALQITNEVALRKRRLTLDQAKELIGHNLAETVKLRTLSESLLGLARQDSTDSSTTRIVLPEVVLDAVQTLAPLAAEKKITIDHTIPAMELIANGPALTQIIRILLDNAIKYSPEASTVSISAEQTAGRTVISVSDHGPGIDSEHHSKIFDRFYRIDASRSSQNVAGNGLGLAIARTIAERHGYELSVVSKLGQGATFSVAIS